jgi:hypothetical protein
MGPTADLVRCCLDCGCSIVLKVHRETLNNILRFWQCLTHKNIKFRTLASTVQAMDASIRHADQVYK